MFVPNSKAVLAIAVVMIAHLALLSLMIGQSPEITQQTVQPPVIQGMLVTATPPAKLEPTPAPPKKVTPRPQPKPEPKPKPEPLVQQQQAETAPAIIEAPPPAPAEPEETTPAEIEQQPEPITEPIAAQPTEAPPLETVMTEVVPPRVDAYQHNNPPPKYPRLSKRLREEGTVLVQLLINKNGTVNEVEIKVSSGYPRLDKAAMKAVKQWRYTPASQGNKTIAYRYEQPVHFSMN